MDIIVCVKHVPDTTEAEIAIRDDEGQLGWHGIKKEGLVFDISEADNYAVEEALLLKEEFDGAVTVLTVGLEGADETLRMCLAKGTDKAVRLTDEVFEGSDSFAIARILSEAIKDMDYGLVLTGVQADDDGAAQVGVTLAEMLGIPHAALVVGLQEEEGKVRVNRELEAGILESYTIELPALLTIQTGINRPRYISLGGIKRAMKKELQVMSPDELGLTVEMLAPQVKLERLEFPPRGKEAVLIPGPSEESAEQLTRILQNAGIF